MGLPSLTVLTMIFVGAAASCLAYVILQAPGRFSRLESGVLLVAVFCVLLWRWPPGGDFFHGLEYEDSYVYTVVARQMLVGLPSDQDSSYLTTVCAVGTLENCELSETYSGHYIGYPYLLWLMARLFGYTPSIGNYVAVCAAALSTILIFLITRILTDDRASPLIAAFTFAWVPVFSVHGVASFAEPLSSMLVAATLYFLLNYAYSAPGSSPSRTSLFAFAFTMALAVSVKRENTLLAVVLPSLAALMALWPRRAIPPRRLACVVVAGVLVLVYVSLELRVTASVASEFVEYGGFPFRIQGLRSMLPAFARAYTESRWYLGTTLLVLVGLAFSLREGRRMLYLVAPFAAYLLLYMTHVRSYYQLQSSDVAAVDALRYSMNLMALWSVLAGIGGGQVCMYVLKRVPPSRRMLVQVFGGAFVFVTAILSYTNTRTLQEEWTTEEYSSRIEPALTVARLAEESDTPILTAEPLVIQMYGDSDLELIDLLGINFGQVDSLIDRDFLYVEQKAYSDAINLVRYDEQLEILNKFEREEIQSGSDFVVYRLTAK